jgi:hypothetical protein
VGKEWASRGENGANFVDLKRLNGWVERNGSKWTNQTDAAQIAAVIDEGTDCGDFWNSVAGTNCVTENDRASEYFLKGFVEGALEIFGQL